LFQVCLYGLQTLSNTVTGFPATRTTFIAILTTEMPEMVPFIHSILKSLPSPAFNKLVDVLLVCLYNTVLGSMIRSQRLYGSSGGQMILLDILTMYSNMEVKTRTICDGLIQALFKEGMVQETFANTSTPALLTDFQTELLRTVCDNREIKELASCYPITLSIFSKLIEITREMIAQYPYPKLLEAPLITSIHTQLQLWLEWFYLISDPETEHGLILRHDTTSISLVNLHLTLIGLLDRSVPKLHNLKNTRNITPSPQTLQGIMTATIRNLSNIIYESQVVQDEIRELGGIPLLLNQCNIDDNNPYLREHAIFAIRSLVTNNATNADLIRTLAPYGPAPSPVLHELNINTELSLDGKPVLTPRTNIGSNIVHSHVQ